MLGMIKINIEIISILNMKQLFDTLASLDSNFGKDIP